jgi:nitrogen fixation NifU-like protein
MSSINELYQEVILDHNRSPRNFREIADADRKVEGFNPLCGDHYTIFVKLDGEVIKDVSFVGAGCAISKASASVMSQVVKGKTRAEADALFEKFHALVTKGTMKPGEVETLGRFAAFAGVSEFPARVKCASLAWHTLHAALDTNETKVSME